MTKPLLLDLFCCSGGSAVGYSRAGFTVIGVDIDPILSADYPYEIHHGDALEFLKSYGGDFDVIHASPPCQSSSALTKGTNKGRQYLDLIPQTRELLATFNVPTVIENVQGAKVRRDLTLCGEMFSLGVLRHRYFEIENATVEVPEHKAHRGRVRGWRHGKYYDGPYVAVYGLGGGKGTVQEWQQAMGIDWTDNRKSLAESIPPAYTEYIGNSLIKSI